VGLPVIAADRGAMIAQIAGGCQGGFSGGESRPP
jgi:hypothetical protein